jgi:hypothetical protein
MPGAARAALPARMLFSLTPAFQAGLGGAFARKAVSTASHPYQCNQCPQMNAAVWGPPLHFLLPLRQPPLQRRNKLNHALARLGVRQTANSRLQVVLQMPRVARRWYRAGHR